MMNNNKTDNCEQCAKDLQNNKMIYAGGVYCGDCYKIAIQVHCLTCDVLIFEDDGTVGNLPDYCYFYCRDCYHMEELLQDYDKEQRATLTKYANEYNITVAEAIEYQTHCHCCGKTVEDPVFHESEHQYCEIDRRCDGGLIQCREACEHFHYPCFRKGDCLVCGIWYYKNTSTRRAELKKSEQILAAISAFQEKRVYAQFYECVPDLIQYF